MEIFTLTLLRRFFVLLVLVVGSVQEVFATHSQGADITYTCLGGNQYRIRLAFYRDCAGQAAPTTASINISSASCGRNFSATLNRVVGTGADVTPVCPSVTTRCGSGSHPGVQEWVYEGTVTLPAQCTDWVFSYGLCCRNDAISTINNPGGDNIYVEARLDNLNFPCSSSPQFSNRPVPYICVNQTYCFNHGAIDPDGDSLAYSFVPPATSATGTVTYIGGLSPTNPIHSTPGVTLNPVTGDICMTPNQLQVSVMAVRVSKYRNGVLVGSVVRDIQVQVINCSNNLPDVSGINGGTSFSTIGCAGAPISFTINSLDADASQNVTMTWNNAIPGATFTTSGGTRPTATFTWTPTMAQISPNPYCFTVTVRDNSCPLNGTQTRSYCITVSGFNNAISTTPASCGQPNGSATVTPSDGIAPYTYSWNTSPVQTTATATGLIAGTYTVQVSDASGCTYTLNAQVNDGDVPPTINLTPDHVACHNGSDGSVSTTVTGGQTPYSYAWAHGPVTPSLTGLAAGSYSLTVTTAGGCVSTASVNITEPAVPLNATSTPQNVSCFGLSDGSATALPSGGTPPYSYSWSTTPVQTTATASNLPAGNYTATVTDANGCTTTVSANVTEPPLLTLGVTGTTAVICNGESNGAATVAAGGGTTPYTYSWNTIPVQSTPTASGLAAGNYTATVTDANGCTTTVSANVTEPPLLTLGVTGTTAVICNGESNGTATVAAGGGTTSYTYSWNTTPVQSTPTATGLAAGNYNATVSDANGCTTTVSANVTEPPLLTLGVTGTTAVICNGESNGTATVAAGGGTTPYTYSWNTTPVQSTPTASGLAAGNYTATVTDANGCTTTVSANVTEPPLLTLGVTGTTAVICNGESNGTATVAAGGGTTPYTYSWNTTPVQSTPTATGLAAGNYTATVTDANGCTTTVSANVTEPPLLTLGVTGTTAVICNGESNGTATVAAGGGTTPYIYSWNTAPVQNTATANGLVAGLHVATVTDANGCTTTISANVTEPPLLTLGVTGTTAVICNGESNGTATVAAGGGTTPYTYSWNTTPVQSTPTATGLAAGSYTATVTDANGCTTTISANVTEPSLLTLSVTGTTAVICNGESNGTATVAAGGGTTPYTYSWNTTPVQSTPTATGLAAGNYNATVTDANGCTANASADITQPTLLTLNVTGTTAVICNGESNGTATVAAGGGTTPYTYSWNTTPVQSTPTATGLAAGNYSATVTDANGCTTTISANVTEPPLLTLSVTGTTAVICNGESNGTATVAAGGGTTPYTYSWNTTPVQNTATANGLVAGLHVATVTDANGCTALISATVTEPTQVQLAVVVTDPISCYGYSDGEIQATASGGIAPYTYSWNTTPVQTTALLSNLSIGSYTATTTDANGCTATASIQLTQPDSIVFSLTGAGIICPGTLATLQVVATGGDNNYSYHWNQGLANVPAHNVSPAQSTTYTVTVSDGNNCPSATQSVLVTVNDIQLVTFSVTATPEICIGSSGSVQAYYNGGYGNYALTWHNGALSGPGPHTVSPPSSLYYVVTLTDDCGNTRTDSAYLEVHPLPLVDLSPQSIVECGSANVVMANNYPNIPGSSFVWDMGDGTILSDEVVIHGYAASGTYTVLLTVTSPQGCVNSASNVVVTTVRPQAIAQFIAIPPEMSIFQPDVRFENQSVNATMFYWEFGDGASSTQVHPEHRYQQPGIYPVTLYANNVHSCPDTLTLHITVRPEFTYYVPNAFTPDGDGINDFFLGKGEHIAEFEMIIFDRWGINVFTTRDQHQGWDGTHLGSRPAQPDVYVYKIKIRDSIVGDYHHFNGHVSLVR